MSLDATAGAGKSTIARNSRSATLRYNRPFMAPGSLKLELIEGPDPAGDMRAIAVDRRQGAVLGRSRECQICLPDPTVSRRHADLTCRGQQWFVRDLKSRHGTYLNAVRLEPDFPQAMADNDLLRVGPWTFRVLLGDRRESLRTEADDEGGTTRGRGSRIMRVSPQELAAHRLHLILDGASRITSARDEAELAQAAVDSALAGTAFDRAAMLRDINRGESVEVLCHRSKKNGGGEFTFSRSLIRAASEGQLSRLTSERKDVPFGVSIEELGITDALCAPVMLGGAVAAYLYLDARDTTIPVQSDAADFCQAIARMCGMALANLKRIDLERRQRGLESQLSAAREAQQMIVPAASGEVLGIRYAMRMQPGSFVAGDLFDVVPLDDRRVALTIGDVTGEGIGAAILMASTQSHLHAALRKHADPAAALNEVNAYIADRSPANRFISMWVGVFDRETKRLTYVDAGHGHWMIRRASRSVEHAPRPNGTLVGIDPGLTYDHREIDLKPGDRLILYSDGLLEQSNPDGDRFGRDRIAEQLYESRSEGDDVARIFAAVERFAGTTTLADDATVASIAVVG